MIDSRIHRVATCGNAIALTALILILLQADRLFRSDQPLMRRSMERLTVSADASANCVVLVVIDGLRLDTARDAELMPSLNRLASQGHTSVAWVQSMVPSSLAGIVALTTGAESPPGKFVFDFYSPAAGRGGVFEMVERDGGRSFVAGPTLWTDLYGRWIADSEIDTTFGRRDRLLLRSSIEALRDNQYRFVVVHFGRPDAKAHQHGSDSAEYRAAVWWCDRAIAEITQEIGTSACLVVTSDHGQTRRGGHAGPEFDVMATPLVVVPRRDVELPPVMPQTAVAPMLLDLLGIREHADAVPASSAPRATWQALGAGAAACAAILCGLRACGGASGRSDGRRLAFVLNSTFWLAAALALLGSTDAAVLVALIALAGTAVAAGPGEAGSVMGRSGVMWMGGAMVGAARLYDGSTALVDGPAIGIGAAWGLLALFAISIAALYGARPWATSAVAALRQLSEVDLGRIGVIVAGGAFAYAVGRGAVLAVFLAAVVVGIAAGRFVSVGASRGVADDQPIPVWWRIASAGAFLPALQFLLSRAVGDTASLSTIDVHRAYEVVNLPGGVALAAVVLVASQAAPTAGLLIGCSQQMIRFTGPQIGVYCLGAAAVMVGQISSGIVALAVADMHLSDAPSVPLASLAVGTVVRGLAEALYLFMGIAVVLLVCTVKGSGRASAV